MPFVILASSASKSSVDELLSALVEAFERSNKNFDTLLTLLCLLFFLNGLSDIGDSCSFMSQACTYIMIEIREKTEKGVKFEIVKRRDKSIQNCTLDLGVMDPLSPAPGSWVAGTYSSNFDSLIF